MPGRWAGHDGRCALRLPLCRLAPILRLTSTFKCATDRERNMQKLFLLTTGGLAGFFLSTAAQAQNGPALTGKVTSAQEPVMEGVLVSAKRDGGAITTTVVTNEQGIY